MPISDDTIEAVRARADIVAVVSPYVTLQKRGRSFLGLCPFHGEKTPSFNVSQERQSWHCFGCGLGGDAFGFLMRIDGLSFPEAVEKLAAQVGVEIEHDRRALERRSERQQILELNQAAAQFYVQQWARAPAAREFAARRGLTEASIAALGLGYAPAAGDVLSSALLRRGTGGDLLEKAGLSRQRETGGYYDLFRDRVIFPIRDVEGRAIAFGGRALGDAQPKYLNSPETPAFDKGRTLYGMDWARKAISDAGVAIVVEGYMDAAMVRQEGVLNVVATLGTALRASHLELLRRYATRVVLAYDGDSAGATAAERSLPLFEETEMDGRILVLPEGRDPDDFIREAGIDSFRRMVDQALPLVEFQIRRLMERHQYATPEGAADLVRAAAPVLAGIRRHTKREEYVSHLAEVICRGQPYRIHQMAEAIWRELRQQESERPRERPLPRAASGDASAAAGASSAPQSPSLSPRVVQGELFVLQGIVAGIVRIEEVAGQASPEDFAVEAHRELARVLWQFRDAADPAAMARQTGRAEGELVDGLVARLLTQQERLPVTAKMVTDSLWAIKERQYQARISELQVQLAHLQSTPGEERSRVETEIQQLQKQSSDFRANKTGSP